MALVVIHPLHSFRDLLRKNFYMKSILHRRLGTRLAPHCCVGVGLALRRARSGVTLVPRASVGLALHSMWARAPRLMRRAWGQPCASCAGRKVSPTHRCQALGARSTSHRVQVWGTISHHGAGIIPAPHVWMQDYLPAHTCEHTPRVIGPYRACSGVRLDPHPNCYGYLQILILVSNLYIWLKS